MLLGKKNVGTPWAFYKYHFGGGTCFEIKMRGF